MTDLLALAAQIEAADGPSRTLDAQIIVLIDWKWSDYEEGEISPKMVADRHGIEWLVERMGRSGASIWRNLPTFTASIDAALTLAPEGWSPVSILLDAINDNCRDNWLEALPRFICAAALKARAGAA